MKSVSPVLLNDRTLQAALTCFPRDRAMWIDSEEVESGGGATFDRYSPAHGALVTRAPRGTAADADRAIAAAKAVDLGTWPKMMASERSGVLLRTADLIDRELLAPLDSLESGKPISQARGEVAGAAGIWRHAAALARTLHGESYASLGSARIGLVLREPIEVVSVITPWNFPLLIVSQELPFAFATGCTCVVKPSEMTSASTLHLARLLDEAGLPKGVCNVVTGYGPEVGAPMTTDPRVDMISFTGSTAIGRAAMAAASATLKKVSMELGGKNPQIIFADADMEAAIDACVFGAYFNAGECCNAGSRILLQRDIADNFVAGLVEKSSAVRVGDPLDPETKVGAIISADHLTKIERHVAAARDAGATLRIGGERLASDGFFMAPTVVDRFDQSMPIANDEVFGPVVTVMTFETLDEAIDLANATTYGLSASVWSRDVDTAVGVVRGVRAGTVWVNTFMDGTPELPFGGYGQSGLGPELGHSAVANYTEEKTLHVHQGLRTSWVAPADLRRTKKIGSQRKASRNGAGPNPVGEYALEGRTMKLRSLLLTSAMAASVLGFATAANAADSKELQMLHWWTSGGEAAALNVLKQDLVKEGYVWKDVPVAGGGGAGAMTTLKAMVAAGNPPTASQILGYFALDYAEAGKLGDITALATKEGWDKVIPTALQKFTTTNGKWDAVPVNIHSVNWIWLNKAVMEKIGGTEPKTFDDFVALLDKAKAANVIPLALGGQPWQEATMFDSVIASTGGIEFYKKAIIELDPAALKSDTMKKAFDDLAKLRSYTDPNYAGRDWNLATAMVIKGDALVQVMGDWAKGEFRAANKEAGKDFICYRFPGTDGAVIYNTDMFAIFNVPADRKAAQTAMAAAAMSKSFQSAFNVIKGSVPARMDVPDADFDMCGKKGMADVKSANASGKFVGSLAQNYAQPPAVAAAYDDVVTKFFHGEIKTSDAAVTELIKAINNAK